MTWTYRECTDLWCKNPRCTAWVAVWHTSMPTPTGTVRVQIRRTFRTLDAAKQFVQEHPEGIR